MSEFLNMSCLLIVLYKTNNIITDVTTPNLILGIKNNCANITNKMIK